MKEAALASILLIASLVGLGGCSYLETQQQQPTSPDTRIQLGQSRVSLSEREIPRYTCEAHYWLLCERGGAISYSCTCVQR